MSEAIKMSIASFELKENRKPTSEELTALELSAEMFFNSETQSGCLINY